MVEGRGQIPALFGGDLGEEYGAGSASGEQDPVSADLYVPGAGDRTQRGEHRYLDAQSVEFVRGQRGETGIAKSRCQGVLTHDFDQWCDPDDGADTAAQAAAEEKQ